MKVFLIIFLAKSGNSKPFSFLNFFIFFGCNPYIFMSEELAAKSVFGS